MSMSQAWADIQTFCRDELSQTLGVDPDKVDVQKIDSDLAFLTQAFEMLSETGFANETAATLMVRCLGSSKPSVKIARDLFAQLTDVGLSEPAERLGRALLSIDAGDSEVAIQLARVKLWNNDLEGAEELVAPQADELNHLWANVVMSEIGIAKNAGWTEDYLLRVFRDTRRQAVRQQRLLAQSVIAREDIRLVAGRWRDLPAQTTSATRSMVAAMLLHAKQPLPAELLPLDFLDTAEERRLWRAEGRFQRDNQPGHIVRALNRTFADASLRPIHLAPQNAPIWLSALRVEKSTEERSGPLVSVILTAYAAEETIDYALRSVLEQSYQNLEIIVVDDASDLPLKDVSSDSRVRTIRMDKNQGPYIARNLGLAHANGAFIAFQDADDWAHPDKIARQVELLSSDPSAMATFGRHVRMDRDGNLVLENDFRFIGDGPVTSLYRREVFDVLGGFAPVRSRGDIEFKARVSAAFGAGSIVQDYAVLLIALYWQSNSRIQSFGPKAAQLRAAKRRYSEEHKLSIFSVSERTVL